MKQLPNFCFSESASIHEVVIGKNSTVAPLQVACSIQNIGVSSPWPLYSCNGVSTVGNVQLRLVMCLASDQNHQKCRVVVLVSFHRFWAPLRVYRIYRQA